MLPAMPISTFRKTKTGPKAKDATDKELAIRTQIRLYPEDLTRIQELIAAGYGTNASEVIRRSLHETYLAELGFKKQRR